jgi:hypothetical protein
MLIHWLICVRLLLKIDVFKYKFNNTKIAETGVCSRKQIFDYCSVLFVPNKMNVWLSSDYTVTRKHIVAPSILHFQERHVTQINHDWLSSATAQQLELMLLPLMVGDANSPEWQQLCRG